jgi:malonyl-CoA/methylmalonyl-CoA synthetase
VGERDQEGSYRILGRLSQDIIKSGGYKVSALEIESALLENPNVAEVAVVGVFDEKWGELVAAAYCLRPKCHFADDDLRDFLTCRLAHYKVPRLWLRTESLPRNAMGKVLKSQVRALFPPMELGK